MSTAKASNKTSQETTAKRRKKKELQKKKVQMYSEGRVKPQDLSTTATGSSSLLTVQDEPYWPPTALPGPFCLRAQSSEQQGC